MEGVNIIEVTDPDVEIGDRISKALLKEAQRMIAEAKPADARELWEEMMLSMVCGAIVVNTIPINQRITSNTIRTLFEYAIAMGWMEMAIDRPDA
jgi:hypothetical protein